jgi:hypothetical protein
MRALRAFAGLVAVAGITLLSAACGAAQVTTTVPGNIAALEAAQPGASLAHYGYVPVAQLFGKDGKVTGDIYVACGHTTNLSTCSSNFNNEGTMLRPNVYVVGDLVTELQGPHDSSIDDRSYFIAVPAAYQKFGSLTSAQQLTLLGVMPAVSRAIGAPEGVGISALALPIGETTAWVSR